MSEEVRRRCLEPFFTPKSGRGVGLGLSIAHGIVQRHRGGISIQSEPGQGARAIVRLPLEGAPERSGGSVGSDGSYGRVAPAQPGEEPAPDRRPPVPSWRVLLVDDEESGRLVVRRYLEADGHTAMLAADGREGLQTFEAGRFDLVILDRAMPGMSGDELATAIKARSPATPVIMLTGFSPTMAGQADPPAAVDKIITKPLTRAALRRAVAEIMAERMPRPESGTA
jgi:CheY-like chemotaxis protein